MSAKLYTIVLKTYKHHVEIAVGLRIVLFNLVLNFSDRHLMFTPINLFILKKQMQVSKWLGKKQRDIIALRVPWWSSG